MAKQRVRGEQGQGSVFQRTDGRWSAMLDLGGARGRRVRKAFYGHSREEVERKLEQAKQKLAKGIALTRNKRRHTSPLTARLPKVSGEMAVTKEFDSAVQQRILDGVTIGLYPEQAATLAGVTVETFNNWSEQAHKSVEPYATLLHAIAATEVKHEAQLLQVVNEAGIVDPRMALKLLELRYPSRWAPATPQTDDAFQQAFQINIHLSHEEGGTSIPAISRPAIDVTPREQPPRDRLIPPQPAPVASPAPAAPRGYGSLSEKLNDEIRARGFVFPMRPAKQRPTNG